MSLVGTNDLHGHIEALPRLGGYLANLRRARARDGGGVVLVDAGDMFQGTLESNLGEGAAVVRAYNALGYAAAAIGNHEFDYGPVGPAAAPRAPGDDARGALKARAAEARFPLLAANLAETRRARRPPWPNVRPTTIVQVAGVKVGVIGMTTMATPRTTMAANFAGLTVKPLAATVIAAARQLRRAGRDGGDRRGARRRLVQPIRTRRRPASCDHNDEIFAAGARPVGRGSARRRRHRRRPHPRGRRARVAGIPIIESYANGRAFGRIDLDIDRARGTVVDARIFRPQMIPAPDKPFAGTYEGARAGARRGGRGRAGARASGRARQARRAAVGRRRAADHARLSDGIAAGQPVRRSDARRAPRRRRRADQRRRRCARTCPPAR